MPDIGPGYDALDGGQVLTCAQTRELERCVSDPGQREYCDRQTGASVPGLELMARAGQACFDEINKMCEGRSGAPLILCGPGGNGGDGFVIARHFLEKGVTPFVFALGRPVAGSDAAVMLTAFEKAGGQVAKDLPPVSSNTSVIVDALFGAGLSRPFDNRPVIKLMKRARENQVPVFAVDMPSGLSGDTGRVLGECAGANRTLTFFTVKPGHLIAQGPEQCGHLMVNDLGMGFPPHISSLSSVSGISLPGFYEPSGHKYDYGHVLVFSGAVGRTGAARLSAMAALRLGAGLVTLAAPDTAMSEIAAQITSIQIRLVNTPYEVNRLLGDVRYNVIVIGPGFGIQDHHRSVIRAVLAHKRQYVLDADALSVFASEPDILFQAVSERDVLTPHAGEFARLFPDLKLDHPDRSKVEQVRTAAKRAGAIVLLKGPDTIIAAPDGEVRIVAAVYDHAAPMLATAGSGDVLAGLIAGRLARNRGLSTLDRVAQAVWIHQELGRILGPGLIAEDLPHAVPELLRRVLASST